MPQAIHLLEGEEPTLISLIRKESISVAQIAICIDQLQLINKVLLILKSVKFIHSHLWLLENIVFFQGRDMLLMLS